jgi:zinc protease
LGNHRSRGRVLTALLLLTPLLVQAPAFSAEAGAPAASTARASSRDVQVHTLKNGMKVIVWADHDIPNVAMYDWFRVGSRNERPGITGLSHFFEHMMFNGSKHYPSGEFDRMLERNGGVSNAFTTEDVTAYQDWFPKGILDLVFRLEADRIQNLSFDPKMVESERQVVYSERRTSVDNDNASLLDEQVQAAAYVAHPYHNPVIGWPSDIERWTIDDLRSYYRIHYAPNNATLIVVGDVTPREIFTMAERYLEPIPAQPAAPKVTTREPPQIGERRVTIRKFGQTPLIDMAFHTGPSNDPQSEARDLLLTILSEGESSRLYRRLVDRDRVAVDVNAFLSPDGFDPGLLKIYVTVPPDQSPDRAEAALLDELALLGRTGPTAEELAKAKNVQLAAYWRRLKAINSKAEWLGIYEVFHGGWQNLFTAPQRYDRVTRAQVQALARTLFDPKNRTVGVLLPEHAEAAAR